MRGNRTYGWEGGGKRVLRDTTPPTYYVEPEVAGELGPGSVVDSSVHPPVVSRLEYVFTDWLGDCIVETFPCYIVTADAADSINAAVHAPCPVRR